MTAQGSALSIENLVVQYDSGKELKIAVDNLSLEVRPGEFVALLGPNGAGKTTTIAAASGLIPFQKGKIKIFGHPAGSLEAKRLIGVVPQEVVSHGFFNLEQILAQASGYHGLRHNKKRIDQLIDRLQLESYRKKKVSQLSGGYRRRMMIAKALVHNPKLLLLDEPSAGVDVELRTVLWKFIRELNEEGMTIILTTHYLEEAQRLCKKSAIVNHGRLLAMDETGELISSMAERVVTIRLKEEIPVTPPTDKNVIDFQQMEKEIRIVVTGQTNLKQIIDLMNIPMEMIMDLRTEEGDLENAFLKIIRNSGGDLKNAL